jgi:hypothetical protein
MDSATPSSPSRYASGCCTLLVAGVAAYSSYEHQRRFAAAGGADPAGARLWPLSVDGQVLLSSVGLLRTGPRTARRDRCTLWLAFGLGIAVSLAANIAPAPALGWQPILVAGWPPVALLLAVELLAHRPSPDPDADPRRPGPHRRHQQLRPRHPRPLAPRRADTNPRRVVAPATRPGAPEAAPLVARSAFDHDGLVRPRCRQVASVGPGSVAFQQLGAAGGGRVWQVGEGLVWSAARRRAWQGPGWPVGCLGWVPAVSMAVGSPQSGDRAGDR